MCKKSTDTGFSALELVIVVLIIGVLAAIALPNVVSASRSYTLNIAATAIAQQLNMCRQVAVRSNLRTTIKIDVDAMSTQIDTTHDDPPEFTDADEPKVLLSTDAQISEMNPDDGLITFTSRGEIPTGAQLPSITVTYAGRTRVVTVGTRGDVNVGPEL
jgi:prepilin-type N-terminal cleavage/methylation domain-containing protein